MLKKVALGIDNFKKLIEDNVYFVDKTLFIKDFMEDASQVSVLPRKFGKILNISMLRYFLDNKEFSKNLFKELEIFKDIEFC